MSRENRAALWARLAESGLVRGEVASASEARSPWYVRLMLGISGWIGALFLFGFVGMAFSFILENTFTSVVVGALLCAGAAYSFRRLAGNDFAVQFSLAGSIAGQILILTGLQRWFGWTILPIALTMAAVQAILFAVLPNVVHRIWTATTAAFAVAWSLGELGLFMIAPGFLAAAFACVWLSEFDVALKGGVLRAAGHGLAIAAALVTVLPAELWPRSQQLGGASFWFGTTLSAAVILWVAVRLLGREGVALSSGRGRIALAGAAILALVSLQAPGVGPGATILLIGFANGHRVLGGLGILTLLAYLVRYYYAMDVTLIVKSAFLAGAGVAMLVARIMLLRAWPAVTPSELHRA